MVYKRPTNYEWLSALVNCGWLSILVNRYVLAAFVFQVLSSTVLVGDSSAQRRYWLPDSQVAPVVVGVILRIIVIPVPSRDRCRHLGGVGLSSLATGAGTQHRLGRGIPFLGVRYLLSVAVT